ncbi:hypothetical protein D3C75_414780 [compost metagenome]
MLEGIKGNIVGCMMGIDNLLNLMKDNKIIFRESRKPALESFISRTAKDQILLVLPLSCQLLWVYEYDDHEKLEQERKRLYKKFKKMYFDGDVVEIVAHNLYLVTSKDKGDPLSEMEERLRHIITGLS